MFKHKLTTTSVINDQSFLDIYERPFGTIVHSMMFHVAFELCDCTASNCSMHQRDTEHTTARTVRGRHSKDWLHPLHGYLTATLNTLRTIIIFLWWCALFYLQFHLSLMNDRH